MHLCLDSGVRLGHCIRKNSGARCRVHYCIGKGQLCVSNGQARCMILAVMYRIGNHLAHISLGFIRRYCVLTVSGTRPIRGIIDQGVGCTRLQTCDLAAGNRPRCGDTAAAILVYAAGCRGKAEACGGSCDGIPGHRGGICRSGVNGF